MRIAQNSHAGFSPREAARALGVSESSLKRWCDQGKLAFGKTAGGHRRIAVRDLLEFAKLAGREIEHPEAIGLPARGRRATVRAEDERTTLQNAFRDGQADVVDGIVLKHVTDGEAVATLFDEVVAPIFHWLGEGWASGEISVYQERRACELIHSTMRRLRALLPQPAKTAPLAIGATVGGDHYTVALAMAELVLRQAGWRTDLLGANIPVESLMDSLMQERPKMLWLSFTHIEDGESLVEDVNHLAEVAKGQGSSVVVGGQALDQSLRESLDYTAYCADFKHFASLANSLK